jgi:hypothetical protein
MYNKHGIVAKLTTNRKLEANSMIERMHEVVHDMLRSFDLERESLDEDNNFDHFLP